jgi:hypothetical protein
MEWTIPKLAQSVPWLIFLTVLAQTIDCPSLLELWNQLVASSCNLGLLIGVTDKYRITQSYS